VITFKREQWSDCTKLTHSDYNVPSTSCSEILEGDLPLLIADYSELGGNDAIVTVSEQMKGRAEQSIVGAPFTVVVKPDGTDASVTTAFGKGLVFGTAGEASKFTVQAKDGHGNNRDDDQANDGFRVVAFHPGVAPELAGSYVEGSVEYVGGGAYACEFVPTRAGKHTIAVTMATEREVQRITTFFAGNSADDKQARGGTFTISYQGSTTEPLAWDADASDVTKVLEALPLLSSVQVVRTAGSFCVTTAPCVTIGTTDEERNGFRYDVTFVSDVGNVPEMTVDAGSLLPAYTDKTKAEVITITPGASTHIHTLKDHGASHAHVAVDCDFTCQNIGCRTMPEIQKVEAIGVTSGSFTLIFNGHETAPMDWSAASAMATGGAYMKTKLEELATVGIVEVAIADSGLDRTWTITFTSGGFTSVDSRNYGPLSLLASDESGLDDGSVTTSRDRFGESPFSAEIEPADTSAAHTTAVQGGVVLQDGVWTSHNTMHGKQRAEFERTAYFTIEARDRFTNRVKRRPYRETQTVNVTGGSGDLIAGSSFTLSFNGESTISLPYNATSLQVEAALEALSTVGDVTVLATDDGSYSVTFVSNEGDLPALVVDTSGLSSSSGAPEASVTACDLYRHQIIKTYIAPGEVIGGTFRLQFQDHVTENLNFSISAPELEEQLEMLPNIINVEVVGSEVGIVGVAEWTVHMIAVEGELGPLYAEEQLLTGTAARIRVTAHCMDGSVAGRHGLHYLARLQGPTEVKADVSHIDGAGTVMPQFSGNDQYQDPLVYSLSLDGTPWKNVTACTNDPWESWGHCMYGDAGRYLVEYEGPRMGSYNMYVEQAQAGGLLGKYFNNRWLFGNPVSSRVDSTIDFDWPGYITETGKDFISIRWSGYIRPAFSEQYTFHVQVNDGARLWVDNVQLFDAFEAEVEDAAQFAEYSYSTNVTLVAGRLYDILLEYRENKGSAFAKLMWSSATQPKTVIPSHYLFHSAEPIGSAAFQGTSVQTSSHFEFISENGLASPFAVTPVGVKSTAPTNAALAIDTDTSLLVTFEVPINDGGTPIIEYKVEWWDANEGYGMKENQTVVVAATGGRFQLGFADDYTEPLHHNITDLDMEKALEALEGMGDLTVVEDEALPGVFRIIFETNVGDAEDITVKQANGLDGTVTVCTGGVVAGVCKSTDSFTGGADNNHDCAVPFVYTPGSPMDCVAFSMDVSLDVVPGQPFSYIIQDLNQLSQHTAGFSARVSARNAIGWSVASAPVTLKPMAVPEVPTQVELVRIAGSSTALKVYWTHGDDQSSPITHYLVEWDVAANFSSADKHEAEYGVFAAACNRVYGNKGDTTAPLDHVDPGWMEYTMTGLQAGTPYHVRISARNSMGFGPVQEAVRPLWRGGTAFPEAVVPRKTADQIAYGVGVTLATVPADDSTSVFDSTQSLRVTWHAPVSDHGVAVSKYNVEWFTQQSTAEVEEITINATATIAGTFQLTYDGETTDHLKHDIDEIDMEKALNGLQTIRHVHVERSNMIDNGYVWTVTFAIDAPAAFGNQITADGTGLSADSGAIPNARVLTTTDGLLAVTHPDQDNHLLSHEVVDVSDGPPFSYTITGLLPGIEYFARVSAFNNRGYNAPQSSLPLKLAPPMQKPDVPTQVTLIVNTATSLKVLWNHPDGSTDTSFGGRSDGGDTVTKYKIEWDTVSSFDSQNGVPVGSNNFIPPTPATDCKQTPCEYVMASLSKGGTYFVRVYSYNTYGYSVRAAASTPGSESPKTQPLPPSLVTVTPASTSSLKVSFPATTDNGGGAVTKYMVEWDAVGQEGYLAHLLPTDAASAMLYSPHEVQTIQVMSTNYDLGGTFRVAFQDYGTSELAYDVSADEMRQQLEKLPGMGAITVSRVQHLKLDSDDVMQENGYIWTVSFLHNGGDLNVAWSTDKFGDVQPMTVSTAQFDLVTTFATSASDGTLTGTGTRSATVATTVGRFAGFEQQIVTTSTSAGLLEGSFTLTFDGATTMPLTHNVSALAMKQQLEALGNTGELYVTQRALNLGHEWTIVFQTLLGNVATITADTGGLSCTVNAASFGVETNEKVVGLLPSMGSSLRGERVLTETDIAGTTIDHIIDGLLTGEHYHVRVSAWNGVGFSYGKTMYSTPALVAPSAVPSAPVSVDVVPISGTELKVTWIVPQHDSGSSITKYRVDWDTHMGVAEQQTIVTSSASPIEGTFAVSFRGQRSAEILSGATEQQMKIAIESLPTVGTVKVTRVGPLNNGYQWTVTFTSNIGDLPALKTHSSLQNGAAVAASELVKGTTPAFDHGTIGINVLPLGTTTLEVKQEVQSITVASGAADLAGYFTVSFMGETSVDIKHDASETDVLLALEGLSTISTVAVTAADVTQSTTAPLARHGKVWQVTFTSETGDLPLLLVKTSTGLDYAPVARGGSLTGTNPEVKVTEVVKGNLDTSFVISGLSATSAYNTRVFAYNGNGWGEAQIAAFASSPSSQPPTSPSDVLVAVAAGSSSESKLYVSWNGPKYTGGDDVSKYVVEWSKTSSFSASTVQVATISTSAGTLDSDAECLTAPCSFTIASLEVATEYYVRVLAYNSFGYGPPMEATPAANEHEEIQQIRIATNSSEASFTLQIGTRAPTASIPATASAAVVQAAIQALSYVHCVGVTRVDESTDYDAAAFTTYKRHWSVTFCGVQRGEVTPSAESGNVDEMEATSTGDVITVSTLRDGLDDNTPWIKPQRVKSSGPIDVTLTHISKTQLGVSWSTPVVTGWAPIAKYLVEWDTAYTFDSTKRTATNPLATAVEFSEVVTATGNAKQQYQIQALDYGTSGVTYYVRVSAFNGFEYSDAVIANGSVVTSVTPHQTSLGLSRTRVNVSECCTSLKTTAQAPYKPDFVSMEISRINAPDQLDVHHRTPTGNHLGYTGTDAGDGGEEITHFRYEWSTSSNFENSLFFDARAIDADGSFDASNNPVNNAKTCHSTACDMPLGAEVQSLSIYSTTSQSLPSGCMDGVPCEFKLAFGSFTEVLCENCTTAYDASSGVITYDGDSGDVQAKLPTGSQFIIDKDGINCKFVVLQQTDETSIYPVTNHSCSGFTDQSYSIYIQKATSPIVYNASSADVQAAILTELATDVVVSREAIEMNPGFGFRWHVTFVGHAAAGDVDPLIVQAVDNEASANGGCGHFPPASMVQAIVAEEFKGGQLVPGTTYFIRVSYVNAVGSSMTTDATGLQFETPNTESLGLAPRSPAGESVGCKVYAITTSNTELFVTWDPVDTTNGAPVTSYLIEYTDMDSQFPTLAELDSDAALSFCTGCATTLATTAGGVSTITTSSNLVSNIIVGDRFRVKDQACSAGTGADHTCIGSGGDYRPYGCMFRATAIDATTITVASGHGCADFSGKTLDVHKMFGDDTTYLVTSAATAPYEQVITDLVAGAYYQLRIRAINDQGDGDYTTICTPTCNLGVEDCTAAATEGGDDSIWVRQLPSKPDFHHSLIDNELAFTEYTVLVTFDDSSNMVLDERVDKYKIEWDTSVAFNSKGSKPLSYEYQLCEKCAIGITGDVITVDVDVKTHLGPGTSITITTTSTTCSFTMPATTPFIAANGANWEITVLPGHGCDNVVFNPGEVSLQGTSPEVFVDGRVDASYDLDALANAAGNVIVYPATAEDDLLIYNIGAGLGLVRGQQYYVRISAHNSLGYGPPADAQIIKPYRSADAPTSVVLSERPVTADADERGTSLDVTWNEPVIDGGDPITQYLIEWSKLAWDTFVKEEQIITTTSTGSAVSGTFRLTLDTSTACDRCPVKASHETAHIPFDATEAQFRTAIQNLPNVGAVRVTRVLDDAVKFTYSWTVTFDTDIGDIPEFTVTKFLATGDVSVASGVNGDCPAANNYCGTSSSPGQTALDCPTVQVTAGSGSSFSHTIYGLTPAQGYFVRVSAFNALGYGTRIPTTPASIVVPKQLPGAPTSFYHAAGKPTLQLASSSSLVVKFGPPSFDGGDEVYQYQIQWDTASSFDSGASGNSLGQTDVAVGNTLCETCVTSLDTSGATHSMQVTQDGLAAWLIQDTKFVVRGCVFTVLDNLATHTTVNVKDDHGCDAFTGAADALTVSNLC